MRRSDPFKITVILVDVTTRSSLCRAACDMHPWAAVLSVTSLRATAAGVAY